MGLYYNKSSHPLPITLLGGGSMTIPPRTRFELHGEHESSSALLVAIEKNQAVRLPDLLAAKVNSGYVSPPPAVVVSQPVAPVVVPLPPVELPPVVTVVPVIQADSIASAVAIALEGMSAENAEPSVKSEDPSGKSESRRDKKKS